MNKDNYVAPDLDKKSFTCAFCGAFAEQIKGSMYVNFSGYISETNYGCAQRCNVCDQTHLWLIDGNDSNGLIYKLIYPLKGNIQLINSDAPDNIKKYYNEAAQIVQYSPRAAAALLRLSIQVLIEDILGKKKDINDGIAELVKKGLPSSVQKAFDIVRLTGNDAVHPGQIDTDDIEVVTKLFKMVNFIIEKMITEPNEIKEIYGELPEEKIEHIEKRDKKSDK